MATEIRMARLSPTMETGTINRWLKKEGDAISSGDAVAEVETDKATMPLEVFEKGKLLKIVAPEGSTVKVDELVAVVGEVGEDITHLVAGSATFSPGQPRQAGTQVAPPAVPTAVQAPSSVAPQRVERREYEQPAQSAPVAAGANGGRVKASPLAKKLASERGIDLRTLRPSGPGGRVVQRDVPAAAAAPAAVAPSSEGVDLPLSNMRQTIARRLLQSKQTIPHWYCFAEVRVDRALEFREELNSNLPEGAPKISVNDLVTKVCAAALRLHPEVNASFNETSIRRYGEINIGFAVATDDGLYTPVLRHVDQLSLAQISQGVKALAQKARDKKLRAEDFVGSGFTITNLGMFGVDHFFAIISPPQSAILAVGAAKAQPVVNDAGQIVAAKVMNLTLSCDHRVIDGAIGAKFLGTIREFLEHPAKLLL